jgi:hypothetical protein
MSKKIIISESEKSEIRRLHNLSEQTVGDALGVLANLIKKYKDTPSSSSTDNTSTSLDTTKISEKGQQLLNDPIFKKKLKEISDAINIDEGSIIKLMKHESGLDPTIKNSIGCVGLIQFCPSSGAIKTINGQQYSLEDLRNNLEVQMEAIKQFWLEGYKSGKIKKPADLYIYNFFPVAAGKSDDFVLKTNNTSAEKIASSNPVFNKTLGRPINTPLTVGDLNQYYKKTNMV